MHTQPTITIELPIHKSLFYECWERPALLLDIFTAQQIVHIKAFVFDNLEDKDGAPEVDDLAVSIFKYSEHDKGGYFRLNFYINRRFCCSDIESSRQDYIDFHFSYINETLKASANYFNWNLM
ncbi:hypothetical protein [Sphingobacterium gobiense]|uniref:Uncharacterized protein n=1 Tax=Sphingobacterium gobiense TaxID=1382456 RepID=A0A2S9JSH3_9SPHI|nr:hypothetical protein [Sphingobacterium gobiense]PRD56236.1 hypothetical protein C5749_02930 [Sphingobacterium gobiense]